MKKVMKLALFAGLIPFAAAANAQLIDFENYKKPNTNDYYWDLGSFEGYKWSNFNIMDRNECVATVCSAPANIGSGYFNGNTSGTFNIVNSGGNDAFLSKVSGGTFTFTSAQMTSAWLADHQVRVTGWLNGQVVNQMDVTLQITGAQLVNFNFAGVDKISFSSISGKGVLAGHYTDHQFTLDDVVLNGVAPVPEPSTYAMMFAGLGILGVMVKRRKIALA